MAGRSFCDILDQCLSTTTGMLHTPWTVMKAIYKIGFKLPYIIKHRALIKFRDLEGWHLFDVSAYSRVGHVLNFHQQTSLLKEFTDAVLSHFVITLSHFVIPIALCNDLVALCNKIAVALCNDLVELCNNFVALCNTCRTL